MLRFYQNRLVAFRGPLAAAALLFGLLALLAALQANQPMRAAWAAAFLLGWFALLLLSLPLITRGVRSGVAFYLPAFVCIVAASLWAVLFADVFPNTYLIFPFTMVLLAAVYHIEGIVIAIAFLPLVLMIESAFGLLGPIRSSEGVTAAAISWGIGLLSWVLLREQLRFARSLEDANQRLASLVNHDALTDLYNRRYFEHALRTEIGRSKRYHRPFSVVLIDLDELKQINDRYGHLAGDAALVRVAECLKTSIRDVDSAARIGGDEFSVLLPDSDGDAAQSLVARLERELSSRALKLEGSGQELFIRSSFGHACYPADAVEQEELLKQADERLYKSKANHRRAHQ